MFPRVVFGGRVLQAQLASASSSSTSRQREHVAPRPSCPGETATLRSRASRSSGYGSGRQSGGLSQSGRVFLTGNERAAPCRGSLGSQEALEKLSLESLALTGPRPQLRRAESRDPGEAAGGTWRCAGRRGRRHPDPARRAGPKAAQEDSADQKRRDSASPPRLSGAEGPPGEKPCAPRGPRFAWGPGQGPRRPTARPL